MFTARVYRIMIGCPGDIHGEVAAVQETIAHWNALHAEHTGVVLLPLHWSTHSYPEQGSHPQKILDRQVAEKSDLLVAVFGSRLGTPTDTEISGTVEEIRKHIEDKKPVMLFFRRNIDASTISLEELKRVLEFKEAVKHNGLYHEYQDEKSFPTVFSDALELFLADNWLKAANANSLPADDDKGTIKFNDGEIQILRSWIESGQNESVEMRLLGGVTKFVLGSLAYDVKPGRDLAEWKDFFDRLQKEGFIRLERYDRHGNPIYSLQKRAYDFIEKQ